MQKTYDVDCYFSMKQGCRVTLYQDAHCLPVDQMPQFQQMQRPDQQPHQPRSCWTDMYESIKEAQEIICITGWAVNTKLQLFRGNDLNKDSRTLGEILKEKANQGVKVYVMIWSEKTSNAVKEFGVMGTHDMTTYNFFKPTLVKCALAPRYVKSYNLFLHMIIIYVFNFSTYRVCT